MPEKTVVRPVRIAVVGHTNTGKTSLMRTLTRDTGFGEVSSRPSTTRHVEGARLIADGEVLVELFDTPGMEDPMALLEELESIRPEGVDRLDGPARVERFLNAPAARARFEQEAKVLRQLRASDAGLYVIDVRDPVLAKHRDELEVLGDCAVPLLPVLNFVRAPQTNESRWREALSRLGLHAIVRFDTVAPERDGERWLYEKLATLLDAWRPSLEKLLACRAREADARHRAAVLLVAELLIDVAAYRVRVMATGAGAVEAKVIELNTRVREREQHCVDALLELYRFRSTDVDADQLPLANGEWQEDLFNPESLRQLGIRFGTGAAAGAAAGAGVDLMVGGLTFGTATAIGALAGGGWQAVRQFGDRVLGSVTGQRQLAVDDGILRFLAVRQLHLLCALETRGHGAISPIHGLVDQVRQWREGALPAPLRKARAHREWSGVDGKAADGLERNRALEQLAELLATDAEAIRRAETR